VPAGAAVGVVALAVAALGACTVGGTGQGTASGSKSASVDGGSLSPMPPGKYKTLPQPCSAVSLNALKSLVPGATDYSGKESLTYDTDRRVGCAWQAATPDGVSRTLSIDLERVVSYDPSISDEVQAETDFNRRAAAVSPPLTPTGSPSGTATTAPPTSPTSSDSADGTSTGTSTPTDSATSSPDLLPRRLTNLGDAAFINDVLKPPASPATSKIGPRRDVTLVFRTANVVVSITYNQSSPRGGASPSSADLQKGARQVAGQLEGRIGG
jgi:hypothetical protein